MSASPTPQSLSVRSQLYPFPLHTVNFWKVPRGGSGGKSKARNLIQNVTVCLRSCRFLGNACGQRQNTVTRGGRATPSAPPQKLCKAPAEPGLPNKITNLQSKLMGAFCNRGEDLLNTIKYHLKPTKNTKNNKKTSTPFKNESDENSEKILKTN